MEKNYNQTKRDREIFSAVSFWVVNYGLWAKFAICGRTPSHCGRIFKFAGEKTDFAGDRT